MITVKGFLRMIRLEAVVYGRVQGVFFRQTTVQEARSLHLTGWVRNEPNGAVRVVAEGNEPSLQQFYSFLHQGPPGAAVTFVEDVWTEATGEYPNFTVKY